MYHAETDTPAKANTSNLAEELGQVSVNNRFSRISTYIPFTL